ncbi:PQQ-dependent sugar dehydrogenase, partial [Mycobacterium rufum]|nr:PQQ-dependent sugar dehydrogenase [Mycolicibacterium rufum]
MLSTVTPSASASGTSANVSLSHPVTATVTATVPDAPTTTRQSSVPVGIRLLTSVLSRLLSPRPADSGESPLMWGVLAWTRRSVDQRSGSPSAAGGSAVPTLALAAAPATPAFVQVAAATPQTAQASVAVTYTAAQIAGDTNVLAIGWNNATSTITSVTDSAGNAYRLASPTARGSGISQAIYYASGIKGTAAGTNTVTVVFNTATPYVDIRALEYSGLDPVNPFDRTASATGTGTAASSGAVTTTAANELIFAAGMTTGAFSGPGTGFSSRIITTPDADIAQDRVVSATGSYGATAALSGSAPWLLQVATFKAATSTGGDTTAPTVSVTAPSGTVSGTVSITATAADNVGVAGVQFLVDNAVVGVEDTASPYAVALDTTALVNGTHTLTARARDTSGNTTVSAPVTITVNNAAAPGTFRNEILATGLNLPTAMTFLPDGRMLVAELGGTVKVLSAPYTQADPTPFLQITNIGTAGDATVEQQGIYDIALDPNYATNHYFYVSYTANTPNRDRLSRFTANATSTGTVAGSELVIYQDTQDANAEHHGGAITFGNDGKIYFTTGDAFQGAPSQSLASPRGKVLRFNTDGTIPTDNPFYDGSGPNYDAVWALGLRNPYRAYYDAPTGRLLIGDVGGNDPSTAVEELNVGVRGANYGWPNVEGNSTNPAYTSPIYSYPHLGRDAAITGGFVYHGTQFPSSYQGSYFFADYAQNTIKRLTFDANGNVNGVFNVDPADGTPDGSTGDVVYLTQGPDGALYYIDIGVSDTTGTVGVSKIRRISYTGSTNLPPVAKASATPTSGATPLTVAFSSAGSSDPEGQTLSYAWDFGDQTTSTAANPTHTYTTPGNYQARLTVSDGVNSTISSPLNVVAGNAPTVSIQSPTDGVTFKAGDVITFSGSATDVEDGTLPASAYTWTFDFLHDTHVHPGTPIVGVTSGTFTVPTSGHDWEDNTRYRVSLTVTDSSGLQTTKSVYVYPQKVNLTFNTAPNGAAIYVDGVAHTTPFVLNDLIGFTHTISAPDQTIGGNTYTFSSWSDGAAQSHTLVVPATAQTYSANFTLANPVTPPGFVQVSAATPQTSQSSVTVKYTGAQTAGNTNVLAIGWNNATSSVTSVVDSAGNTYQLAVPPARGNGISQAIYYAANIKGSTAGSNTVTVTFNTATPYVDLRALEYSGLDRVNPFDVGASAAGTGTTASSGAVTTTSANALVFAAGMTTGAFLGAGTGFSSRIITTPDADLAQDRLVSTAGTYSATAPLGASSAWLMQVAAFRAAAVTDTTAPSVSVTAPNTTLSGTVALSATASDNVGVAGVQFLVDNVAVGAQDTTSPYGVSWDTTTVTNGTHTLTARATDSSGNTALSAPITVTVNNGATDTIAPTVAVTAPSGTVSGTLTLSATASDNVAVAGVQFLVDNTAVGAQDTTSPYSVSWNSATVANGTHTVTARATDTSGNTTLSAPVT